MTSFLRILAWVWAALLLVVLVGTFRPETPGIGLAGSFLSGAYPLHVALAAVLGILFGLAARAAGARFTGVATAVLALAAVVGSVTVLAAQGRAASAQGVPLDWTATLTELGQPDGRPDRSVEFAPGRTLDLYLPTGAGPHPTMVWVHGGSWTSGDRGDRPALNRWLAERGWNGGRPAFAFAAMLLGHALCLMLGGLWLATLIGTEKAMLAGVVPFLLGSLVKSGLGAAILMALARRTNKAEQA